MLPLVQAHRHQQGDGLRNAAAARKGGDAFQAVDNQHSKNSCGQHPAQIPHHLRRLLILGREHHKGQKTGEHGGGCAHRNGQAHLNGGHAPTSPVSSAGLSAFSMGLRRASSRIRMHPMEGSRKLPEPKNTRHASGAARPIRAL